MSETTITISRTKKAQEEKKTVEAARDLLAPANTKIKSKDDLLRFIRERRAELGKTQAEIAAALDYKSGDYWSLLETGRRTLDEDKMPALADELKVNRDSFVKMYLKFYSPNVYYSLWGKEELDLHAPAEQKKFARITDLEVELINKLNRMPANDRRAIIHMIDLAATKAGV